MCSGVRGIGLGDLAEEPQEFLVPVPGIVGVGDLGGEQRSGALPDVVMGVLLGYPGPHPMPSAAYLRVHAITVGLDTPVLRTISHAASTSQSYGGTSTLTVNDISRRPGTRILGQGISLTGY
jgi:hypothetical protein